MNRDRFDAFTRLLATITSRRTTVGTLLGLAMGSAAAISNFATTSAAKTKAKDRARKRHKRAKRRQTRRGRNPNAAAVSGEAVQCQPPRPSANLSGCTYNNDDLRGADLSSSRMVGTRFRGANLCGADLSSSNLKDADFRGFAGGNPTNLTKADLSSSGCRGIETNERTIFCHTRDCNGNVRDDDCPGVAPEDICCDNADCLEHWQCVDGRCSPDCDVCQPPGACTYDTVEEAIKNTPAGGTIRICPGVYEAGDVAIDKRLTIIGSGLGGSGTTLIAGGGSGRVLDIDDPLGTVRIAHVSVTGGANVSAGGGIRIRGQYRGVVLEGVAVTGNEASYGGGIFLDRDVFLLMEDCHVSDNEATFDGGGIFSLGNLTLSDGCSVTLNTSGRNGGGIHIEDDAVTLDGSHVSENSATESGGGISVGIGGNLTLRPGAFVSSNAAGTDGGGILNRGTARLGSNTSVADNDADNDGGGIYNIETLTLESGSSVTENEAGHEGGGVHNRGNLTIQDDGRVTFNRAGDGGGIYNLGNVGNSGDISANVPNQCAGNSVQNCP